MKKFILLTAIASTATVSTVAPVMAQISPAGTLNVSSTVEKSCTQPVTVSAIVPNYDGTADRQITSPINFKCTKETIGTVKFRSTSTGSETGGGTLSSTSSRDTLNYTLSGQNSTAIGKGLSDIPENVIGVPVTVRVAAGQDVVPAAYSDTINVTVSY